VSGELEIVTGPLAGRRLPLRGEVTVGRADTDLELNDAEVSRAHAVLRAQPDGTAEVEDLGSTNGTYIDDVPVIGPALLGPGQQLRIGSTVLRLGGAAVTAAHAAPPTVEAPAADPPRQAFAVPTVRRRHGERSAALLMGPTVLTFVTIALTAIALLVYFVAR